MRFLKQHYEKLLLGVALCAVAVAVVAMFVLVQKEKDDLESQRTGLIRRPVKPLMMPGEFEADSALIDGFPVVHQLDFSSGNRLFNPVLWEKGKDDKPIKMQEAEVLLRQIQVTNQTPLYFVVSFAKADVTDSGITYGILIDHQAEGGKRGPFFVSNGQKKEYTLPGGKKNSFTLVSTNGAPDDPTLTLELNDLPDKITITKEKPNKEVEGYMIDIRLDALKLLRPHLRVGSTVAINGEDYSIANITRSEVTLSAKSNNKKTTIQYSAEP